MKSMSEFYFLFLQPTQKLLNSFSVGEKVGNKGYSGIDPSMWSSINYLDSILENFLTPLPALFDIFLNLLTFT